MSKCGNIFKAFVITISGILAFIILLIAGLAAFDYCVTYFSNTTPLTKLIDKQPNYIYESRNIRVPYKSTTMDSEGKFGVGYVEGKKYILFAYEDVSVNNGEKYPYSDDVMLEAVADAKFEGTDIREGNTILWDIFFYRYGEIERTPIAWITIEKRIDKIYVSRIAAGTSKTVMRYNTYHYSEEDLELRAGSMVASCMNHFKAYLNMNGIDLKKI